MTDLILPILGVILLDIVLSGDNALIIALAANQLPDRQRDQAILFGMSAALVLRIIFCALAGIILSLPFIGPAAHLLGGAYLIYVAYQLYLSQANEGNTAPTKATLLSALFTIIVADISMSFDNIVAIAGLAGTSYAIMALGLIVSVLLLALCAKAIANLLRRYAWLNFIGAALVALVGVKMLVGLVV